MKQRTAIDWMLVLFVAICSFTLFANNSFDLVYSNNSYTEIDFILGDYIIEPVQFNGREFHRVNHPQGIMMMEAGLPDLPMFTISLIIPDRGDVTLESIEILDSHLENNLIIMPSQGFEDSVSPMTAIDYNQSFYTAGSLYPQEIGRIGEPKILRDFRFVTLLVTPFQHNPSEKTLRVSSKLRIRVAHNSSVTGENELNRNRETISRSFENIYRNTFINYDQHTERTTQYQARSILVIYHHNPTIEPIVNMFVEWKRQKGFEITATNTSTMSTNTAIKNYIQSAYDNWEHPPEYLILIGGGSGSLSIPYYSAHSSSPGDHPYSLLSGEDDIADLFLGRLSINNQDNLLTIWNKIRNYERVPYMVDTDWYKHTLLVADQATSGTSTISISKYVKELMLKHNREYSFTEVYSSPFPSQINNALNEGAIFYSYRGWINMSSWSPNDNDLYNGFRLSNNFFLTCSTLNYTGNSSAERMVTLGTPTTPRGGITAIGMTTTATKTAFNNALLGGMVYGIFDEGIRTMGEALLRGKVFLHETFDIVHPSHPPQFSHWTNLIGDPSMDIWIDTPKVMTAIYNPTLPIGRNYIDVTVNDTAGLPIIDAWVTVYQQDNIFSTGYTNSDGRITHFFDPNNSGEVKLTITKPDYRPVLGSFQLSGQESVTLDDVLTVEPFASGETTSFLTSVVNLLPDTVNNLSGVLSVNNTMVELITTESNFGNINAGDTATNDPPFTVRLSESLPDLTPVIFTLSLTDDADNQWHSKFEIIVNGSNLEITEILIAGSRPYIESNETGDLTIRLHNNGQTPLNNLYGEITSYNPLIQVIDSLAFFGSIDTGESGSSSADNPFRIKAIEETITGMQIPLELYLYNDSGYQSRRSITLPIGNVEVTDPLGPDSYGYYIYGMEDEDYEQRPEYDWIEIAPHNGGDGINTGLQADWDNVQEIVTMDLPFDFSFYGRSYDHLTISANGWISFGETEQYTFRNWILPGPIGPKQIVAAFWDNLNLSSGGVYTYHDSEMDIFIIQWDNAKNVVNSAEETFQIILYNPESETAYTDGRIKIQYKVFNNLNNATLPSYGNYGNYCTVGIADHTGNVGLQYTFANQYPTAAGVLGNETAIMIVGPKNFHDPLLLRESIVIYDSDNSNYVDAGEEVRLGIYLRNIGFATATDVTGTLRSTSPFINLTAPIASYYDIESNSEEVNISFFKFQTSPVTPNNHTANFILEVTTSSGSTEFPFQITVSQPNLALRTYLLQEIEGNNNGLIEPGERFKIALEWKNNSLTEIRNAQLTIESLSNYLTLEQTNLNIGNIPAQITLQQGVLMAVSPETPLEEIITFKYNITGTNIATSEGKISFGLGEVNTLFNFEESDDGFSTNDTAGWSWGIPSISVEDGNKVWGTVLDGNYADNANWTLDSPEIVVPPESVLKFQHYYAIENYWDGGNVKISTDSGESWQLIYPEGGYSVSSVNSGNAGIPNQPAYSGSSNGWKEARFDFSPYFGQKVKIRWHFGSGPWVNDKGWFINNVRIESKNPLYSYITGSINLEQSPIAFSNVIITTGSYSTKAANSGDYTLIVPPGSYELSALLPYHFDNTTYEIELEELEYADNKDFNLKYFTPPDNLLYTYFEEELRVDLSWDYNPLPSSRTETHSERNHQFNIYRQQDSGFFILINTTEDLTYTDTIPTADSVFKYFVRAEYPEGESDKSNLVSTDLMNYNVEQTDEVPLLFSLRQNYPNPFNPSTNITFSLPHSERVLLEIYNIKGELIITLIDEILPVGEHTYRWDGVNNRNRPVSSGVYFYRIRAGLFEATKKALLLK